MSLLNKINAEVHYHVEGFTGGKAAALALVGLPGITCIALGILGRYQFLGVGFQRVGPLLATTGILITALDLYALLHSLVSYCSKRKEMHDYIEDQSTSSDWWENQFKTLEKSDSSRFCPQSIESESDILGVVFERGASKKRSIHIFVDVLDAKIFAENKLTL